MLLHVIARRVGWPRIAMTINSAFIAVYKVAGFVVLGAIVFGMVAYLTTSGIYLVSQRWIVPGILTPSNDKVIQARFNYLTQVEQVHRLEADLAAQKKELDLLAKQRDRFDSFTQELTGSLEGEIQKFRAELRNIRQFLAILPAMKTSTAAGTETRKQLQKQFNARLISLEQYMKGLVDAGRLSKLQYDDRQFLVTLKERQRALERILKDSYNAEGKLDLARFVTTIFSAGDLSLIEKYQIYLNTVQKHEELLTREEQAHLQATVLEKSLAQISENVSRIESHPTIKAGTQTIYTAFAPYENLGSVDSGVAIYGCYLHFILCRKVGTAGTRFESEVIGKHPLTGNEIRGQIVELSLTDSGWAESKSLFVKRPPLFF